MSADTLAAIKKSQTAGIDTTLGLTGIDLSGPISLIPVPATFYDSLAKTAPEQAGPLAIWRVLLNINNQQSDPGTAFNFAAPLHLNSLTTVSAPYAKLGYGYTVTRDAISLAKGFADAQAIEIYGAMSQYKIGCDKKALGGQAFALATPTGVKVVPSATGGSIAASTAVPVKVAARTGSNYYYGGSTVASTAGTATTAAGTATNSAVVTVPFVRGAVAYDWFVNNFYYTTTVVNTVTVTSIPTTNQPVPLLPGLSATQPTSVPTVDASAKATDFNGLLASMAGDYNTSSAGGLVTPGSGTPSGTTFVSLDGGGFTGSGQNIPQLDQLNMQIWQTTFLSPSAYMCASVDAAAISTLLLATASGGTTYLMPGTDGRTDMTAGGFIGYYINKAAGGVPVKIEVHPNMIPGTLVARTDQVNFPNSNITNVFELRSLDEVQNYEYATARIAGVSGGGPRFDGEVFSTSTLINKVPAAQAVLCNIQS